MTLRTLLSDPAILMIIGVIVGSAAAIGVIVGWR